MAMVKANQPTLTPLLDDGLPPLFLLRPDNDVQGWDEGVEGEVRAYAGGQRASVTAWYALVPDTIDETMWELLERKRGVVGAVTDGAMQRDLVRRMVTDA